jgi:hypothetical protein
VIGHTTAVWQGYAARYLGIENPELTASMRNPAQFLESLIDCLIASIVGSLRLASINQKNERMGYRFNHILRRHCPASIDILNRSSDAWRSEQRDIFIGAFIFMLRGGPDFKIPSRSRIFRAIGFDTEASCIADLPRECLPRLHFPSEHDLPTVLFSLGKCAL